jgi:predicted GNAT family acetyltransferase
MTAPAITDDPAGSRFTACLDGNVAELVYRVNGRRLVLLHTEVPDAFRGHGMGGQLVRAAVERAARDHLTIVPRCPFARRWLAEHPDVASSVDVDALASGT